MPRRVVDGLLGVKLGDLFPAHPVPEGWYDGKRIAVDGHNVAFRYLTSFRGKDGDVLRNPSGKAIAHLIGFTNLVRHLRERGAEPIIVWDGDIHQMKSATVQARIDNRRSVEERVHDDEQKLHRLADVGLERFGQEELQALALDIALLQGQRDDLAGQESTAVSRRGLAAVERSLAERRDEQATWATRPPAEYALHRKGTLERELYALRPRLVYLDGGMIRDASRVFEALGVAVVRAPHDGERYAAALCHAGHAHAVATEDYDALVAGAPFVLRKAGSPEPWLHQLGDLAAVGLTQEQLRAVAILSGTDWHPGVTGYGAKTAAKLVKAGDLRALLREAAAGGGGKAGERFRSDGFTLELFEELDAYIRELPTAAAPATAKPDPGKAKELAAELGLDASRLLACYC